MSSIHLSNNLEKIIQLISIEQLMGLMKQMKNTNIDNIFQEMNNIVPEKTTTETSQLEQINNTLLLIFDKISSIESEIQSMKQSKQTDFNCDEEHIKLKIEEKDIIVTKEDIVIDNLNMNIDLDDELEEEYMENEDMDVFISKIDEAIAEMEKKADKMEVVVEAVIENSSEAEKDDQSVISEKEEVVSEKEEVISEEEEVVSEEEELEEEVASEEEAEDDTEEEISDEEEVVSNTNEEEVVNLAVVNLAENLEEKQEEEETEEEVFEIEIDDITYFATHEENGILYEVDENGEPGKKVGIIKDGEPIFS